MPLLQLQSLLAPAHGWGQTRCKCIRAQGRHTRVTTLPRRMQPVQTRAMQPSSTSLAGPRPAPNVVLSPQLTPSSSGQPGPDPASAGMPQRTSLLNIRVQNFALVEEQSIQFGLALNAVTGESGSGKSVLVEALNQLLGGPAPPECVRDPSDMALVEGTFWLSGATAQLVRRALEAEGATAKALPPARPCQLVIRREILKQDVPNSSNGSTSSSSRAALRSRCFVGGSPVTLRALRALGGLLVDLNGQHSSLALREGATQMALLDRVAGCGGLVAQVNGLIASMAEVESRLEALDALSDSRERDIRRKLVEAVRRVRCVAGEEVVLRREVRALDARRNAAEQCAAVRAALAGDSMGGGGLVAAVKAVEAQIRGAMAATGTAASARPSGLAASRVRGTTPAARAAALATPYAPARAATPVRGRSSAPSTTSATQQEAVRDARRVTKGGAGGSGANGATTTVVPGEVQGAGTSLNSDHHGSDQDEDMHVSHGESSNQGNGAGQQQQPQAPTAAAALAGTASGRMGLGAGAGEGSGNGVAGPGQARQRRGLQEGEGEDADGEDGEEDEEEEEEEEEEECSQLVQALDALAAARQQMSAAEALVRSYGRESALDLQEYDEKSERLQTLDKLLRSQRCRTTEELLEAAETAQKQLAEYDDMAGHAEEWEADLERLRGALATAACQLSAARRRAAPALARHVEGCLQDLAMGGARVDVTVTWQLEPHATRLRECEALDVPPALAQPLGERGGAAYRLRPSAGLDVVELRLAAGPAEPLRPLGAVASGGESARVMLALKAAVGLPAGAVGEAADGGVRGDGGGERASDWAGSGNGSGADAMVSAVASERASVRGQGAAAGMQAGGIAGAGGDAASTDIVEDVEVEEEEEEEEGAAVAAPVLVLDELDSGIGSRLGASVGALLRRMAGGGAGGGAGAGPAGAGSQIICVTHLPQVACYAQHHVKVSKVQGGGLEGGGGSRGRVTTCFQVLGSFGERSEEVAAMMGMDLGVAEDMLRAAQAAGLSATGAQAAGPSTTGAPAAGLGAAGAQAAGPSMTGTPAAEPAGTQTALPSMAGALAAAPSTTGLARSADNGTAAVSQLSVEQSQQPQQPQEQEPQHPQHPQQQQQQHSQPIHSSSQERPDMPPASTSGTGPDPALLLGSAPDPGAEQHAAPPQAWSREALPGGPPAMGALAATAGSGGWGRGLEGQQSNGQAHEMHVAACREDNINEGAMI